MEQHPAKEPYVAPDIFELGSAGDLTMGQSGPSVDADAQHAPKGPTPAGTHF